MSSSISEDFTHSTPLNYSSNTSNNASQTQMPLVADTDAALCLAYEPTHMRAPKPRQSAAQIGFTPLTNAPQSTVTAASTTSTVATTASHSTNLNHSPPELVTFPPIAPSIDVEVLRRTLQRELEEVKEETRELYISSARRMIEMQDKIDVLTRENVRLIRTLAPSAIHW